MLQSNMNKIISALNNIGRDYINDNFVFHQKPPFLYVGNSDYLTSAVNFRKNDSQQVKVLNWFEDFWLYIEIRFVPNVSKKKKNIPNIFFSLSLFQGTPGNNEKTQLFRAEWYNYIEPSDKHPQPHWHIYTKKDIEEITKTFDKLLESPDDNFEDFIKTDGNIVDIDRFHFAMNGQWSNNNSDVHKIEVESDLTNWFAGVLNHIKKELEYLKVN